ncbi:FecR family protein [Pedobacter nyackensis]|uniref:FecR family protein n=1 Tax=Pedobacter nyackensis TaxID=475255 RepID=UPI00292CCE1F|nr:FecR domain-containing protein [Pedobacter nyackensis]
MKKAKALIEKYKAGTCTPEEMRLIDKWLLEIHAGENSTLSDTDFEQIQAEIWREVKPAAVKNPVRKLWPLYKQIGIAAAIVLMAGAAIYFFNAGTSSTSDLAHYTGTIKPGGSKAYLTTSDGKRISLTDATDGQIANEAGVSIVKHKNGELVYKLTGTVTKNTKKENIHINTLETPRGGQYQIELPDGTKVWLNAESTLKFPSTFSKLNGDRTVEMIGEAYFEVAKDKAHPFIVKSNGQEIKVLGTHFNVKNYVQDGNIKTTLLEGAVQVNTKDQQQVILKPGQQALVKGRTIDVQQADTELAVAWKNNKFMFEKESIRDVMAMVERWYDVDVVYQGEVTDDLFGGSVLRSDDITVVLKSLELTGKVHFKIEGRRILVTK